MNQLEICLNHISQQVSQIPQATEISSNEDLIQAREEEMIEGLINSQNEESMNAIQIENRLNQELKAKDQNSPENTIKPTKPGEASVQIQRDSLTEEIVYSSENESEDEEALLNMRKKYIKFFEDDISVFKRLLRNNKRLNFELYSIEEEDDEEEGEDQEKNSKYFTRANSDQLNSLSKIFKSKDRSWNEDIKSFKKFISGNSMSCKKINTSSPTKVFKEDFKGDFEVPYLNQVNPENPTLKSSKNSSEVLFTIKKSFEEDFC